MLSKKKEKIEEQISPELASTKKEARIQTAEGLKRSHIQKKKQGLKAKGRLQE